MLEAPALPHSRDGALAIDRVVVQPAHAGADRVVRLVERTHVPRVLVVIDDFVAVCHIKLLI